MDVDPEEVLRSTAQARFDHAVEPHVLDSLPGQGIVNSDECHRWLPRADPEIRPEMSAVHRGLEAAGLRPSAIARVLPSPIIADVVSKDVLRLDCASTSRSWSTSSAA